MLENQKVLIFDAIFIIMVRDGEDDHADVRYMIKDASIGNKFAYNESD